MIIQGNLMMGKGYIDEIVCPVVVPFSQSILVEASSTRTTTHVHYSKLIVAILFSETAMCKSTAVTSQIPQYVPH